MMERNVYGIYEMFAHLSLEQKKGVLRDFQEIVDAEESRPEGSYLEQKWKEIEDCLYDLSLEPYIDDQLEIDVIWNICDELIKEGKFSDILDEDFKNNIVSSAPMHDIGKIKVSDTILNKPGKFEPWEYEIMKTHAEEGAKIIHTVKKTVENEELKENYLGEAENMAHYHHEKWNGQGYPCGLKGEEIPLSARIMAVADVFDALVAVRVYKPAMPFEKAVSIIKEGSGEHFDPDVVEAFVNAEEKIRAVTDKLHK